MAHMQGWESDDDLYHPLDTQWEQPDGNVQIAFHIRGVVASICICNVTINVVVDYKCVVYNVWYICAILFCIMSCAFL